MTLSAFLFTLWAALWIAASVVMIRLESNRNSGGSLIFVAACVLLAGLVMIGVGWLIWGLFA